ncbi:hypothetical protein FS749_013939 [Ceratobasidium sp. UAMH 11750]|nr:hypothetical protein FS749_013939 [Ceratobasidium sp. UAMH 11750]
MGLGLEWGIHGGGLIHQLIHQPTIATFALACARPTPPSLIQESQGSPRDVIGERGAETVEGTPSPWPRGRTSAVLNHAQLPYGLESFDYKIPHVYDRSQGTLRSVAPSHDRYVSPRPNQTRNRGYGPLCIGFLGIPECLEEPEDNKSGYLGHAVLGRRAEDHSILSAESLPSTDEVKYVPIRKPNSQPTWSSEPILATVTQERGQNEANLDPVGKGLGGYEGCLSHEPGGSSPENLSKHAPEAVDRPPSGAVVSCAARIRFDPAERDTTVASSPRTATPEPLVKSEDCAPWPSSRHDDMLREAPASYPTLVGSPNGCTRVSLDGPVKIPLSDAQIDHSMSDCAPDTPTLCRKDHDRSIEYSHPTDEKLTLPIKKEDVDHASELSNSNDDLATRIHEEPPPRPCPPRRTVPTCSLSRGPRFSQDLPPLPNFIRELGQQVRLNHESLAASLLEYLLGLGLPRSLSLLLSRQITTRFTTKVRACGNFPNGGSNAPGSQSGVGISATFGRASGDFSFEDGSGMWPTQDPGRQQLDLEQLQTEFGEWLLLSSLAEKYGQDLVPRHPVPTRTLPIRPVNLSPVPPVPLPPNSSLGPSYSTLLTETGPNLDFDPGWPPPFDRLIPDDCTPYGGVRAPASSHPPTTPYSPWREGHGSSSIQPLPDLLTEDCGYNVHDAPQNVPEGQGNFQSVLAPAGVPGGLTSPDPGEYALCNIFASTATNGDQQFAAPGHSMSVALSTTGHSGPHIPQDSRVNKRNSGTASQIGPKRTARKVCPVEGCGRTFPRPHLLEDHVNFVHKKNRGHRCTFPGCNKSYSNQTGMRKHYKDKHKSHDAEPSTHAGGSPVDRVPD